VPIYIALLKGINVGGKNLLKMIALKAAFENAGFKNVVTYKQSGNIIFEAKKSTPSLLETQISALIFNNFNLSIATFVISAQDFENSIHKNPLINNTNYDTGFMHITFLADSPKTIDITKLMQTPLQNDAIEIIEQSIYLYCPGGYSATKFTNAKIEATLKCTATTRNWKTCIAILSLLATIKF
jgi:uncharacterized protein (DUF1697 family)